MDRSNHYEAAFEAYLRHLGIGFVAVDEARRSFLEQSPVKSADFIIVNGATCKLVVDVKGRKFPGGSPHLPRKVWQNWCCLEDLDGLSLWAQHFGSEFQPLIVFAYWIVKPFRMPVDTIDLFEFRDRSYLFRGIEAGRYREFMRPRSRRWNTVHLRTADFRALIQPIQRFLAPDDPQRQATNWEPAISNSSFQELFQLNTGIPG